MKNKNINGDEITEKISRVKGIPPLLNKE